MCDNNFEYCYGCKNQLLFHKNDIDKFLEKYLYKKPNKQLLNIVYRLLPDITDYIDDEYIDKFNDIMKDVFEPDIGINGTDTYMFENLFFQEDIKAESYIDCIICNHFFCPLHIKLTSFFNKICKCQKNIQVCSFCYNLFNTDYICMLIHKKLNFDYTDIFLV